MVGAVTGWDVLFHPVATVRCFGWRIFFRAVFPWRRTTFLSLLQEADVFGPATRRLPAILGRCVELELRAGRVYAALAKAFAEEPVGPGRVSWFFHVLAEQEREHADLLRICRAAAMHGGWKTDHIHSRQDCAARLEQHMEGAEASVHALDSVDDALRLVIQIESSEINQVFEAILAAADSPFVRRLRPFRRAMDSHVEYICRQIPKLAPDLTSACRQLRVKFRPVK